MILINFSSYLKNIFKKKKKFKLNFKIYIRIIAENKIFLQIRPLSYLQL